MKRNLLTALKNLLKAYGGSNSNKTNVIQVIDEITETLGGENLKSKNLVEAVDNLSNQVSQYDNGNSSDNPNEIQVIQGTMENMFGNISIGKLIDAIDANEATAFFNFPNPTGFTDSIKLYLNPTFDLNGLFTDIIDFSDGSMAANFSWARTGHLSGITVEQNGIITTDLRDAMASVETELTIIWHPLPSTTD